MGLGEVSVGDRLKRGIQAVLGNLLSIYEDFLELPHYIIGIIFGDDLIIVTV